MTSLPCKKFKKIFTLKRGHKGQFICIQKNIKLTAIIELRRDGRALVLLNTYCRCVLQLLLVVSIFLNVSDLLSYPNRAFPSKS